MELMKPWKSPGKRRASTGTPARASACGVGLALVAQRVEARGDDQAGAESSGRGESSGESSGSAGSDALRQEVAGVPLHQLVGEEEALAEQLARRGAPAVASTAG